MGENTNDTLVFIRGRKIDCVPLFQFTIAAEVGHRLILEALVYMGCVVGGTCSCEKAAYIMAITSKAAYKLIAIEIEEDK